MAIPVIFFYLFMVKNYKLRIIHKLIINQPDNTELLVDLLPSCIDGYIVCT